MRRSGLHLGALIAALFASISIGGGAGAQTRVLEYRIRHPLFGDVGTYANRIEKHGEATTVISTLHGLVDLVGIPLRREEAERTEQWQGGRIVRFDGITVSSDKRWAVHGEARGNEFVITSPSGTATAPADVVPGNPWSCAFLNAKTIFAVDTGRIEPSHTSGGEPVVLNLGGRSVTTRHYRVDGGDQRGEFWFDERCVPVVMTTVKEGAEITLTLAGESGRP